MNPDEIKDLPKGEYLDKLVELKKAYYAGSPKVSDSTYDELERYFLQEYPELEGQLPVGTTLDEFEKVEHPEPMGSLDKIRSKSSVESWEESHGNEGRIQYQPKMDGTAVELIYEEDRLTYTLTRGEGDKGEDVTHVGRVLDMVPNFVSDFEDTEMAILRGEAVLHKEDHPGEARRNLATGSLKSLDPTVALERNLQIYVHTLVQLPDDINHLDYEERLEYLRQNGFKVSPIYDYFHDYDEPWFDVPYDVDGVVIKAVDGEEKSAIAYKFPEDTHYAQVQDVSFQLGRTQKITPVLEVSPIHIDGRTLERINMGSFELFEEADLGPGDTVEVKFANDVIPHMESVVERTDSERFSLHSCPECNGEIGMDGSHLYCQNEGCQKYRRKRFHSMLGGFDIDGLGGEMKSDLGELYDWDLIKLVRDFDSSGSPPRELRDLDGWGEKTTQSIWEQTVKAVHNLTYYDLFRILSLDGFGKKTRKKYLRANSEDPYPLTEEKLLNTPMVQSKTAEKVMSSFEEVQDVADFLLWVAIGETELGVRTDEELSGGVLDGVQVFVTGSLDFGTRSEFKDFIKENGGSYGKSQNAILVTNNPDSSSNKAQYARENGCEILTEDQFFEKFGLRDNEDDGATLDDFA